MGEDELTALEEGDINEWAGICSARGDIMPSDDTILINMFHLARMRNKKVHVLTRVASRDLLKEKGIVTDEPVTVLERLAAKNYPNRINLEVKKLLGEADEVILIFPYARVRDRWFMRVSEELRGILDMKRSSINNMELYTTHNGHVKFLLEHDDYDLPDKKIVYRTINSVI